MRGKNCTALWIKALYKCSPFTIYHVLGDLLQDSVVAKIADDLYCGADTPLELVHNWKRVLQVLHRCDLHLSASKTVINPGFTTILG